MSKILPCSDSLPYFASTLNEGILEYGYSPVQLMFRSSNRNETDLLSFNHNLEDIEAYMERLTTFIQEARKTHEKRMSARMLHNLKYINLRRSPKTFQLGDLVLCRNISLVGCRTAKTLYFPGILLEVNKSQNSALIQTFHTKGVIKCNFSFARKIIKPMFLKLSENLQAEIIRSIREKVGRDFSSDHSDAGISQADENTSFPSQDPEQIYEDLSDQQSSQLE